MHMCALARKRTHVSLRTHTARVICVLRWHQGRARPLHSLKREYEDQFDGHDKKGLDGQGRKSNQAHKLRHAGGESKACQSFRWMAGGPRALGRMGIIPNAGNVEGCGGVPHLKIESCQISISCFLIDMKSYPRFWRVFYRDLHHVSVPVFEFSTFQKLKKHEISKLQKASKTQIPSLNNPKFPNYLILLSVN